MPLGDGEIRQSEGQTTRQMLLDDVDFVSVTKPRDPVPHMPLDDPRSLLVGGYLPAARRQLRIVRDEQALAGEQIQVDEVPAHLYDHLYGYFGFWAMDSGIVYGDASEHFLAGYCADMEEALRTEVRVRRKESAPGAANEEPIPKPAEAVATTPQDAKPAEAAAPVTAEEEPSPKPAEDAATNEQGSKPAEASALGGEAAVAAETAEA